MKKRAFLLMANIILWSVITLQAQSLKEVWSTENVFETPESAYYDADDQVIYISNIAGNPTAKDGNGFISILNKDGSIRKLKWVTGLNAPKGITVFDHKLFVTDIDHVITIDIRSGEIIKKTRVMGARFLNDLTHDQNGNLYISDTQLSIIFTIKMAKVDIWLYGSADLVRPNGMAMLNGKILIGTEKGILEADPKNRSTRMPVKHSGMIDGLVPLNNGFIISDWKGKIEFVNDQKDIVLSNTTAKDINAADLGFIPDEKLILIPTFSDNRVIGMRYSGQ